MSQAEAPAVLWEPSPDFAEATVMRRFMDWLRAERGVDVEDYDELWNWSVTELDDFWGAIWDFFEVEAAEPYSSVLGSRSMPGAEWFPGSRLSYAQHIFRGKDPASVAIRHASELRELQTMTWGELLDLTGRIAGGLRALGVEPGDRVVAYMPNIPETIAAFLACASIGATWSSCSPDFGARSVVDRFAQIEPKVLFTVDGYRYNGKDFDRMDDGRRPRGRDAVARAHGRRARTSTSSPTATRSRRRCCGTTCSRAGRARRSSSSSFRSTIRSGSSTRPGRPGCRRRSCRARAASCSST